MLKRTKNIYGQNKWEYVKKLNRKILNWKPTLDKISWQDGFSVHSEGADHNFIFDIKSIYYDAIPPYNFSPSNEDLVKYWEMGFFNPDFDNAGVSINDKSKYFIMVNRRCVPDTNNTGDLRQLKIKFDTTDLVGFTNWKIIDLDSNKIVRTFDKDSNIYINMGVYQPGEGRLYKLAPVMQEGGTLVTNEDCSGEFDCKGEVSNNGFDINIRPGTTINFADSTARIIMIEGNFKSGITPSENTSPVYLKGKNGNLWKGIKLQNCLYVEMLTTYFENISPYELDSTYAADIINCGFINIQACSFGSDLDINAGGIRANFISYPARVQAYIINNRFEMDAGSIPALSFISSAGLTFPLIIENNIFISINGNSSNAILLNNITGGAIKNNNISGYKNGVLMLSSSMDFYGNIINGGNEDSKGILSYASSCANLGPDGKAYTGGFNSISCEGEYAKCMDLNNSFTYLNDGINIFNLDNYEPGNAFHISGTIPDIVCEETGGETDAAGNCFRISNNDTDAVQNLECINNEPFNFNINPYYCDGNPLDGMIAFDLGNGKYDTIYTESGGSGGGKSNYELQISNYENKRKCRADHG